MPGEVAVELTAGRRHPAPVNRLLEKLPLSGRAGHRTPTRLGTRPTGEAWQRRHLRILVVLLAHIPALLAFGLVRGYPLAHVAVDVLPVAMAAALASSPLVGERLRSVITSVGLMTAASVLVHLANGQTEAHFLYFVLLGVLALYDDWLPYAAAVVFVLVEHGVMGVVDPSGIWANAGSRTSPWTWALIHGGFFLAASFATFVSWRWREAERSEADRRLRISEEHFRLTFEAAPTGMALIGLDGRFLRVNPALCSMLGYPTDVLLRSRFEAIAHPDDLALDRVNIRRFLAGSIDHHETETRYLHRDGHEVWVEVSIGVARDATGQPAHLVVHVIDITERRSASARLVESEARFAALIEHGSDLISISDPTGRMVYASPAYRRMLGLDPAGRLGQLMQDQVHPDDLATVAATRSALTSAPNASATIQFRQAHADGSWRWVEATMTNRVDDPAVGGFVTNTRDVTERVLAAEHLAHLAAHDGLTGLANRKRLEERMAQERASAARAGELLAAFFIDIDHFKVINDTYGHGTGDLLLVEAARRLQGSARINDTVARIGGDEFVVIARIADEAEVEQLASRLVAAFAEPFPLDGGPLAVTASVGAATTHQCDSGLDVDLLDAADVALYQAKAAGRARWALYRPGMRALAGRS